METPYLTAPVSRKNRSIEQNSSSSEDEICDNYAHEQGPTEMPDIFTSQEDRLRYILEKPGS